MVEIWDIYDENRIKTGETMARGKPAPEGAYHLVVHVCLFNSRGEMLIQQRQPFKSGWPDMWDVTVGGSAVAGENSIAAAEREVMEEIGYPLRLKQKNLILTVPFDWGFDDFYLVEAEPDLKLLKLQPEEVQRVKWASIQEILEKIREGKFIPYLESLIQLLFDLYRGKRGCHQ